VFEAVERHEQGVIQPPAAAAAVDGRGLSGRSLGAKLDAPSAKYR
jgi:hypothetical protein